MRIILWSVLSLIACRAYPEQQPTYRVTVQVRTDHNEPVVGALVVIDGSHKETTQQRGDATLQLAGREGQRIRIDVTCPDAFRPHAGAIDTVLRTLGELDGRGQRSVSVGTTCLPSVRKGVLVVRSQGAGSIPVWIDGVVAGHTGENEIAHIPLTLVPGSSLRVTLDTTATPRLRPASPTHRFVVEDRDGILLLDQAFTRATPKRARRSNTPSPELPYRVVSGAASRSGLRIN